MIQQPALTKEDVEHVALLARLELTPTEVTQYQAELNSVLAVVQALNEIPTTDGSTLRQTQGSPTLTSVSGLVNVTRPDAVGPELTREEALLNAPSTDGQHFTVPGVL